MPDGSRFFGALSFGNPYNNGGGVCEFSGTGGSIITPNSGGSLINSWGTWTFSDTIDPGGYGTFVNLNGVRNPCGGAASFLLLYNNLIYARTGFGEWLQNFGPPNFCWHTIVSDPRTPLNSLSTGVSLSGLGGTTQHCTVIATQNGQSGANDIAISVTGASPIPTVTLTPSSTPIWTSSAINTPLSQIGITMSDGSTFTGIKSITNDASGICVISGQYVVLAKIVTAATYNCTIVATQGSQTGSAILTIVASDPTLTLVFGTPHPAVLSTVPVGFQLSAITVTVSDGSLFHGTLGFGGTYGNGSGDCALSGSTPGSYLTVGRSLSPGIHNCSVVATQ